MDEAKQKVTYMQFMEDTLNTAKSFRKSGRMVYASNPEGGEVVIEQLLCDVFGRVGVYGAVR